MSSNQTKFQHQSKVRLGMAYEKESALIKLLMMAYGTLVITSKGRTSWVETSRSTKPISRKSATQNEQNGISPTLDGVDTIQPARSFFAYGDTRFQPRKDSTDRRPDKKLSSPTQLRGYKSGYKARRDTVISSPLAQNLGAFDRPWSCGRC